VPEKHFETNAGDSVVNGLQVKAKTGQVVTDRTRAAEKRFLFVQSRLSAAPYALAFWI
jgi:hypothetical protein